MKAKIKGQPNVVLTLTHEEAVDLYKTIAAVGNSPEGTFQKVYTALRELLGPIRPYTADESALVAKWQDGAL